VFGIPELDALDAHLEMIISPSDQRAIFDIARQGEEIGENDYPGTHTLYRRGILDIASNCASNDMGAHRFRLSGFYTRLDVFVLSELELWRTLPRELRSALDSWYFNAYYARLPIDSSHPATEDAVLTLNETLSFIEREEREPYLVNCDCRALAQELWTQRCEKPLETCITFKNGPNTSAHRGIARRVSKADACDVIRRADDAGLIHRANAGTICNCCMDCCYLSRAEERRNREIRFYENPLAAAWPLQNKRVELQDARCVSCGRCVERCPRGLFEAHGGQIAVDVVRCIGCGLCVNTCMAGALSLVPREDKECECTQ
jgi:Pyruvate/2-oxoacid:ferredoxin oxidoreductase delta subunit